MSEPVTEFTISRRRWRRGRGFEADNCLRDSSHKQCCLGFLARANGYLAKEIEGRGTLRSLDFSRVPIDEGWPPLNRCGLTHDIHNQLIRVNDDSYIREAVREQMLTEEFAKVGIAVRFVR